MNTNRKSFPRWSLIISSLGIIVLTMACLGGAVGTPTVDEGTLQINDGVIKVLDEKGEWSPVAGTATFELVGGLESTDPWIVAGTTLETNEMTQIEEGLQIGDLVRVRGTVLDDETWVAYSIEGTDEQTDPIIILIGVVDSIDPSWVVNGIELNVTDGTDIRGEITVGTIVRVEILLLSDGTWEVLSIAPLGETTETSGCVTVIATVVSVDRNEVQFLGWPTTVTIGDDEQTDDNEENDNEDNENSEEGEDNENEDEDEDEEGDENKGQTEVTLSADQVILAVVCISNDGRLIIVQIILLEDPDNEDNGDVTGGEKVLVCHKPSKNAHTLSISSSAVPAHLAHGDTLGPCP